MAVTGLVISIWGIFQLVLMGVFFFVRSPGLIEDLPLNETEFMDDALHNRGAGIDQAYQQQAYNCWIAAVLYAGLLVFSGQQLFMNLRQSTYTGM